MEKETKTVTCTCGKTVESAIIGSSGYGVKKASDETGWKWIMMRDGGSTWICKDCYDECKKLIDRAIEITGSEYFAVNSFVDKNNACLDFGPRTV